MIVVDNFTRTPATIDSIEKGNYVAAVNSAKEGEGVILAKSAKTGRVKVRLGGENVIWVDPTLLTIVPDDARVLDCFKCGGSGRYQGGGSVVNGVYKGFEGECFACEGHGKQTPKDRHRNRTYWNKYARISA